MLHDIGIFQTDAPGIHCFGSQPYICHGRLGAELLRKIPAQETPVQGEPVPPEGAEEKPPSLKLDDVIVHEAETKAAQLLQHAQTEARKLLDEARAWAGRGASPERVLRDLLTLRSIRYTKTKNFDTYGRGWLRRVHACGILAGSLL